MPGVLGGGGQEACLAACRAGQKRSRWLRARRGAEAQGGAQAQEAADRRALGGASRQGRRLQRGVRDGRGVPPRRARALEVVEDRRGQGVVLGPGEVGVLRGF